MGTKTKSFDCVAMKDRIQARLVAEYERRKDEFPSYMAFIRATAAESDWVQRFRARRQGHRSDGST
ncbi:MAG: hypothetical protein ACODAJ_09500 [Planctomycetota bacterium]